MDDLGANILMIDSRDFEKFLLKYLPQIHPFGMVEVVINVVHVQ